MKKTIITILITLILILTCTISTISIYINPQTENKTYYFAATYGPAWLKIFTKIEIINGKGEQINQINTLLTRHRLQRDEKIYVFVKNLTFNVTYNLPTTRFSRFLHRTIYTEINFSEYQDLIFSQSHQDLKDFINDSFQTLRNNINIIKIRRHSLTFKNFTGFFYLIKPKLYRTIPPKLFIPTKFAFVGVCEDLIIN